MLSLESSKDEAFSDYFINYLLAETFKSFYAIIDGLTIDPVWVPKAAVNKDYRIKKRYIKLLKKGSTNWNS